MFVFGQSFTNAQFQLNKHSLQSKNSMVICFNPNDQRKKRKVAYPGGQAKIQ